jgi:hypothetical protein
LAGSTNLTFRFSIAIVILAATKILEDDQIHVFIHNFATGSPREDPSLVFLQGTDLLTQLTMKMKNLIPLLSLTLAVLLSFSLQHANAQSGNAIHQGRSLIGVGAGISGLWPATNNGVAMRATYDYAIVDAGYGGALTLGGIVASAFPKNCYNMVLGLRFAYHNCFQTTNFHGWVGLAGGAKYSIYRDPLPGTKNPIKPYFAGYIGVAYYFSRNFGVFAEGGFDITWASGGLMIRM